MPTLGTAQATIDILQKYGFHFSKKLGQNFLIDPHVIGKIIAAAGVGSDDFVLEIGPGIGTLTQYLCEAAGKVCAVEQCLHRYHAAYAAAAAHEHSPVEPAACRLKRAQEAGAVGIVPDSPAILYGYAVDGGIAKRRVIECVHIFHDRSLVGDGHIEAVEPQELIHAAREVFGRYVEKGIVRLDAFKLR